MGDRGKGGEKRKLGRGEEETRMLPTWERALPELWSRVCVCECMGGLEPAREDRPHCTIKASEAEGRGRKGQREDRGGWGVGAGGEASEGKPAAVAALSINSPEELALRT